jgi:hypothetical protein
MTRRVARAERKVLSWARNYCLDQFEALGYRTIKRTAEPGLARNFPVPLYKSLAPQSTPRHLFGPGVATGEPGTWRAYPQPPYGSEPLVILYPSPAHHFDKDEPSANSRVGGVRGYDSEQATVVTAESTGAEWLGQKVKRDEQDDLLDGIGKWFIPEDRRGDDNLDDDPVDDPHDGLIAKDVEEDDAEDEDAIAAR